MFKKDINANGTSIMDLRCITNGASLIVAQDDVDGILRAMGVHEDPVGDMTRISGVVLRPDLRNPSESKDVVPPPLIPPIRQDSVALDPESSTARLKSAPGNTQASTSRLSSPPNDQRSSSASEVSSTADLLYIDNDVPRPVLREHRLLCIIHPWRAMTQEQADAAREYAITPVGTRTGAEDNYRSHRQFSEPGPHSQFRWPNAYVYPAHMQARDDQLKKDLAERAALRASAEIKNEVGGAPPKRKADVLDSEGEEERPRVPSVESEADPRRSKRMREQPGGDAGGRIMKRSYPPTPA